MGEAYSTGAKAMSKALVFEIYCAERHEGDLPFETEAAEFVVECMPTSWSEVTQFLPTG